MGLVDLHLTDSSVRREHLDSAAMPAGNDSICFEFGRPVLVGATGHFESNNLSVGERDLSIVAGQAAQGSLTSSTIRTAEDLNVKEGTKTLNIYYSFAANTVKKIKLK
jgi:hypothetical protein